jgi:tetratricopeptide (TPR) repeat protein
MEDAALHRRLAVEANNSTWELLGRPYEELTPDEADEMTARAYTAAYHWARAEGRTPRNDARAAYLIAKVWWTQGNGPLALHHAERCFRITTEQGYGDFDLGYAHEAMARSLGLLGRLDEAREHRAKALAVPIAEAEDREIYESDLAAGPWFGVDGE